MTDPITPPPELVQQWINEAPPQDYSYYIIKQAVQWGADQELEACIAWMKKMGYWGEDGQAISLLRAARRPKPPSLKDLALSELETILNELHRANGSILTASAIRRALEALPDD